MGLWNKKPEEKKGGDQTKSEADLLVERLGATIDEKLKPISEKVEAVSAWQTKLEEQFQDPPPDPNKNADGSEITPEQKSEKHNATLLAMAVQTNARVTENECIAAIQGTWPQLVAEARELFVKTPWQRKAQADYPEYCNNIVDMLVGRAAKKGGLRYEKNSDKFLIEDSAAGTVGEDSPLNDPDLTWVDPRNPNRPPMTASEQLAKLRIDPKEFAESMKRGVV